MRTNTTTEHNTTVTRRGLSPQSYRWYARCSCGWNSAGHASERGASDDAAEHVAALSR